jgi:hypothetical protein
MKLLEKRITENLPFLINLSVPLGIGISSVLFIVLNLLGLSLLLVCIIECIAISYLLYDQWKLIKTTNYHRPNFNQLLQQPLLLLITVIYIYALLLNAGIFFFDSIKDPHGLWDAYNYWNLKAKMISHAPDEWPQLFHQMVSEDFHVDYPLLQTGYIAFCWLLLKNETVWVPILISFIFTFCTIGLLTAAVSSFTTRIKGLIAGLILLCTPFYMTMGDSQYADNTAGFFYLATIVLLTYTRSGEKVSTSKQLIMCGITAGLSAWSKNEGLLFIVCLFISQLSFVFMKDHRKVFSEMKHVLYGMLPILILIIYYKMTIAPPNDIVKAQGGETLNKLTNSSRYALVGKWYIDTAGSFGKWLFNPLWLFLIGAFYPGITFKKNRGALITDITLLLLMISGFFFIYIITPLDLTFHLSTSLHRLFFQLFPSFIFIYFLSLKERKT